MYSCGGYLTCAGYPGSFGYEWIDARTFAEWEVDFLKYDYCFHPASTEGHTIYKRMGLALANCGRDILFSACSWGADYTRQWIRETGPSLGDWGPHLALHRGYQRILGPHQAAVPVPNCGPRVQRPRLL